MTGWPTGWLTDWLTGTWLADSLLVITFLYVIELQAKRFFFELELSCLAELLEVLR